MASPRDPFLTLSPEEIQSQCRFEFHKASGHGGQKINKTSSAVRLVHEPTGLTAVSSESRSQSVNRRIACGKLRKLAVLSFREPAGSAVPSSSVPSLSNPGAYLPWLALILDYVRENLPVPGFSRSAVRRILRRDPEVWRYLSERKEKEYASFFARSAAGEEEA